MVSRLLGCQRRKKIHSTSKTTVVRWRHHLLYRQILRLLLRRYKDVNLIALTLTQTNIINHTGCSYGYKVVCCYDDTNSKPVLVIHARSDANYFKDIYTGYRNIADYNFRLNNLEKVIYKIKGYYWVRSHTAVQYY